MNGVEPEVHDGILVYTGLTELFEWNEIMVNKGCNVFGSTAWNNDIHRIEWNRKFRMEGIKDHTRDRRPKSFFLLSSTGQIKNCTRHLSVQCTTLTSLLQTN